MPDAPAHDPAHEPASPTPSHPAVIARLADIEEVTSGVRPTPAKHVALFIYALTGGGAQRRTVTLANAFAACGHDVDLVVVRGKGVLDGELAPRVRLVELRCHGRLHVLARRLGGQRGIETAAAIPALVRYLRRVKPDVLLSAASHVNLVAVAAIRLAAVPIPLVLRASNHPSGNLAHHPPVQRLVRAWLKWLSRRFYPRADAVVAVSDGVARELMRLAGLPSERVHTIPNPVVDAALERRLAESVEHPWLAPDAPPVVLAAGRLKLQKDFPTLIRAFARLRRQHAARLVILGEGSGRAALEALAARKGLVPGRDVLFAGYVANPLPWMRRARLFVLSSLWEGLPGVLIEALAAGCPIVATDCPSGPAEILDGGRYGRLVPVGDPRALAEAMAAALAKAPDRAALEARARVFGPQASVQAYLDVLEAVIRQRARARLAWAAPWPISVPIAWSSADGLDRALGRVGLGRGDLFRIFAGNAPHRLLLARMLERFGVDPDRAARMDWQPMVEADRRCAGCEAVKICRPWLEAGTPVDEVAGFCPNAGLFARLSVTAPHQPA